MATRNPDLLIWYRRDNGMPGSIDGVFTDDHGVQRGLYSGETLEDIGKRYPNPVITHYEEYSLAHDAAWESKPERTTAENFERMLECLPPLHWHHGERCESFKMVERLSGSMTNIYARVGDEFWTFIGRDDMTPVQIYAAIDAARG